MAPEASESRRPSGCGRIRLTAPQEPKDENAERVSLAKRSLLDLYRHMVGLPEFRDEPRRRRRSETRFDGDPVRWAYRLMRFEEIDEVAGQSIAAERVSLGVLVDELYFDVGLFTRLEERTFAAYPGLPFARMFS